MQWVIIQSNALYVHVLVAVSICPDDYFVLFPYLMRAHRLFSLSALHILDSSKSSWPIQDLWLIFIQIYAKYTVLPWQHERMPNCNYL